MKKLQVANYSLKTLKNCFLRKRKFTLIIFLSVLLFSCSRESMIDSSGEISTKILSDPLFEKMDKAFYDVNINMLTYRNEKINQNITLSTKMDIKNKKIKSYKEYYNRQEQAGYKDFEKRFVANLYFKKCQSELLQKYPELEANKRKFSEFFIKNSKHKITPQAFLQTYKKNQNLK